MVHRSESELHFDDIVFENRNKSYGAYQIRNIYNSYLLRAILAAVIVFSGALLSPKIVSLFKSEEPVQEEEIKITEVILAEPPPIDPKTTPPPPPPKIEQPKPAVKIATTKFLPPKIMEDKKVIEEVKPPSQEEMKESNPGEVDQEGETENLNEVITSGNGNGNAAVEDNNEILVFVGEPSEFQGNYANFLRKNLRYPKKALNDEIQGKVYLKFVVEKDGSITDIKVLKGLGYGCDEEAVRVVQLTNHKWSVAKNNGKPVRAYKNLAIEFRLMVQDE